MMKKGYMLFKEVMNINGNKVGFSDGCIMVQLNTNERLSGRFRDFQQAVGMSMGELVENYIDFAYLSNGINEVKLDDIGIERTTLLDNWNKDNVGDVCIILDDSYISLKFQKYTKEFFDKLLVKEYGVNTLSKYNYIEDEHYIDEDYDTLIINGYVTWQNEPAEKYLEQIDKILATAKLNRAEAEIMEELKLWPRNELLKDGNLVDGWYYSHGKKFDYDQREASIKALLDNESLTDEQAEFIAYLNYRFVGNFFLKPWKHEHPLYCIGLSSKKEREELQKKYSKKK